MKRGWQNQGFGVRTLWDEEHLLSVLVKCLVITSIIYVLCNGIVIITRKILSSVTELSNCPGSCKNLAFRQLYFKERVSQLVDPHHMLPLHFLVVRGGGRRS